ncbi:MAG: thioredoxin domain-containing protein [Acidimicrobiales bacterium]
MNRLAEEASPYLRQHRDNPVDWYPWGSEAFEAARSLDRPILLSVGYAACHWCHVMAHESFENDQIAAVMNEHFINVKVDREERPDVDAIYMEAVQSLTGRGGWPMTVFCTPDGKPFFGGTYFPDRARSGMPGFADVCLAVSRAWTEKRDGVLAQAGALTSALGASARLGAAEGPKPGLAELKRARDGLSARFDAARGGFGPAPKFPQTDQLEILLLTHRISPSDTHSLTMVTTTLDAMAAGGIYDHLAGGFARYSVDEDWLVPHFEKMLYDQALLVRSYLHGWQVTGKADYRQVVAETIGYVLADLAAPGGGFSSSEDADSEGSEGRFYVWTTSEIEAIVGSQAPAALAWWGVTPGGNFEGSNILYRPPGAPLGRPSEVEQARLLLAEARAKRVRPGLDDKVLAEWNGLFIAALAEAGSAMGERSWVDRAVEAAEFCCSTLRRADGRWLRSWQAGRPGRHLGVAADYAALLEAFLALAQATGEARWLSEATQTAGAMIELFWDTENGGLFTTGHDAEALITRPKDIIDGAVPSANGSAAVSLLRLSALGGDPTWAERADQILLLLAEPVNRHPSAFPRLLTAAALAEVSATEVIITGQRRDLVDQVLAGFFPLAVVAHGQVASGLPGAEIRQDGLAYVCRDYHCERPVATREDLATLLT